MNLDIARIRFHYYIGKFRYENVKDISVGDACIVNTEEGQEFGTVVCFSKAADVPPGDIISFDGHGRPIDKDEPEEEIGDHEGRDKGGKGKLKRKRVKNDLNRIYEVVRKATPEDHKRHESNKEAEEVAFTTCKHKIEKHDLSMKLISVHYFFDRTKLLFEFIADQRVDFRELVKDLAAHFRTRIELRQIGVRDEAKIVGGCGLCGRELCCNLMKSEFEAISIKMAKEQNMPLNTSKISGLCGRLMCCLCYEYDTYVSLKKDLPYVGQKILFNDSPATIRDVNPLSRKVLLETEDHRSVYVKVEDIQRKKEKLVVTVNTE